MLCVSVYAWMLAASKSRCANKRKEGIGLNKIRMVNSERGKHI